MSKRMLWGTIITVTLLASGLLLFRSSELQNEPYRGRGDLDWDRPGTSSINWI